MEGATDEVGLGNIGGETNKLGLGGWGPLLAKGGTGFVSSDYEDGREGFEVRGGPLNPQEAVFGPNERVFRGGFGEEGVAEGMGE